MKYYNTLSLVILATSLSGCMKIGWHQDLNRCHNAQKELAQLTPQCCDLRDATLDEFLHIAEQRNLDLMVKQQEIDFQHEIATGEKFQMIPNLFSNSEFSERNNIPGSASQSLVPGVPPAPPSVSSEKQVKRWDFSLTWNIMDFGISYFRSRQEANREIIQMIEWNRLRQNLITDVTRNYWQAVMAQKAVNELRELIQKLQNHHLKLEKNSERKWISRTLILENQQRVIEMQMILEEQKREYDTAIEELKRLLGIVVPNDKIQLRDITYDSIDVTFPNIEELEKLSLRYRAELHVQDIQEKVDIDEVRAAFLEMFPGISIFGAENQDKNKFLLHNEWLTYGIRTSWDLFAIPYHLKRISASNARQVLTEKNRLSLAMAVIAQVNIAYWLFQHDREQYLLSKEMESVKLSLADEALKRRNVGQYDEADVLRYEVQSMEARVRALTAYSDMQVSLEQINNAIGIPRYLRTKEFCKITSN